LERHILWEPWAEPGLEHLCLDQQADGVVAYIDFPSLRVTTDRQRYTCVEHVSDDTIYRYESLSSDFTADLRVDAEGLVVEYARLFRCRWSSAISGLQTPGN
jgi:hypothetical protein